MKRTPAFFLFLASFPLVAAHATKPGDDRSAAPAVSVPTASAEDYYFACLKTFRPDDLGCLDSIDFAQFRRSYFEATKGDRLPVLDQDVEQKLGTAFGLRRWDEVIALADTILNANYTRIRAHTLKGYAQRQLGQDGVFHFALAQRLIQSILATGDGRSFETAFHVLFVEEEYDILKHLQLQFGGQSLTTHKNRQFDLIEARDAAGNSFKVYFDVTEHMQTLDSLFK